VRTGGAEAQVAEEKKKKPTYPIWDESSLVKWYLSKKFNLSDDKGVGKDIETVKNFISGMDGSR
jgi:hypothetical protein